MVHLRLDHVSKTFSGGSAESVPVLDDITFHLEIPGILAVVGPNGCGKSTLLRLISGLLKPDSGSISVNGKPPIPGSVRFVHTSCPVFPWMRTLDDIALGGRAAGMSRSDARESAREVIGRFQFDLPIDRPSGTLSSGQRQFVNLCRALVSPSPLTLLALDEPWNALQLGMRRQFSEQLLAVWKELNCSIVIAAHEIDLALSLAHHVLVIDGRPFSCGPEAVVPTGNRGVPGEAEASTPTTLLEDVTRAVMQGWSGILKQ